MVTIELPVSGRRVNVRDPSGCDDVVLAEAHACDARLALALVERLAAPADDEPADWRDVPVTDLDVLVLQIRRAVFGDWIRAALPCPEPECSEWMDVTFEIEAYLRHHAPAVPDGVRAGDAAGWFELADGGLAFRAPTAGDFAEIAAVPDAAEELARRCLRPADPPAADRVRAEAALATIAPDLADELSAVCPECGAELPLPFDPLIFSLRELREAAGTVFEEVHLLATAYRWSEAEILALPRRRRNLYAELVRDSQRAP